MKINTEQYYQQKMKQYQEEQLLKQTQKQWNAYLYHQQEGIKMEKREKCPAGYSEEW